MGNPLRCVVYLLLLLSDVCSNWCFVCVHFVLAMQGCNLVSSTPGQILTIDKLPVSKMDRERFKEVSMDRFYKVICVFTAVLFVYLFIQLFFMSDAFVKGLGLEPSVTSLVLARRVSMFMIGISVLMIAALNLASNSRWIICLPTGFTMFGLSCMGIYEYMAGHVNSSIFVAVTLETILWISFATIAINDKTRRSIRIFRN